MWLDVTQWENLRAPMKKRIERYANKGCMAIELDNTDCYTNMCVSGKSESQILSATEKYVKWLADTAHSNGMAIGFKNSQRLIPKLKNNVEFFVNEECIQVGSACIPRCFPPLF